MDIIVDPYSPTPLYQQVHDQIVRGIAMGSLVRGDALVSVRRLGAAFGVNPATIAKGYDLLRGEGLVETNAKSGTFIARDRTSGLPPPGFEEPWRERLAVLLAEARAQGLPPEGIRAAVDDVLMSLENAPDAVTASRADADGPEERPEESGDRRE